MKLEKDVIYEATCEDHLRISEIDLLYKGFGYRFIIEDYKDDKNISIYKILDIPEYPEFPMTEESFKKYFDLKQIKRDYIIEELLKV